jgi:hypothetical protein
VSQTNQKQHPEKETRTSQFLKRHHRAQIQSDQTAKSKKTKKIEPDAPENQTANSVESAKASKK